MTILDAAYQIVPGSAKSISVGQSESTDSVRIGTHYLITTNTDCYVRFSGSAVAATDGNFDAFIPAGGALVLRATHGTIRAIRATADGIVGVSEIASV